MSHFLLPKFPQYLPLNHFQPLLECWYHQETELSLSLVYLLEDHLYHKNKIGPRIEPWCTPCSVFLKSYIYISSWSVCITSLIIYFKMLFSNLIGKIQTILLLPSWFHKRLIYKPECYIHDMLLIKHKKFPLGLIFFSMASWLLSVNLWITLSVIFPFPLSEAILSSF